jgi:hypothetical protein
LFHNCGLSSGFQISSDPVSRHNAAVIASSGNQSSSSWQE